jgi:flagellar basal-body rod protein FlgC
MDLMNNMNISAGGMLAQSQRMKVAAENIANADSVQRDGREGPYRAKQVLFSTAVDTHGNSRVTSRVTEDNRTPLNAVYNPSSDLADARGFVLMPNVNTTMESINMREASRSYEANMAAISTAREMATRTLDLLR